MTQIFTNAKQLRGYFIKGLLVALGVAAAIGIWTLLTAKFGPVEGRILLSTLLVGIYAVLCLCCLALAGRSLEVVGLLGVITSTAALVTGLWLVWSMFNWGSGDYTFYEFMLKTFYMTGVAGVSFAHASLLLLLSDRPGKIIQRFIFYTLVAIAVVATMLVYPVLNNFEGLDEFYWRLLGVVAILDVVGTIATPVIAKMSKS